MMNKKYLEYLSSLESWFKDWDNNGKFKQKEFLKTFNITSKDYKSWKDGSKKPNKKQIFLMERHMHVPAEKLFDAFKIRFSKTKKDEKLILSLIDKADQMRWGGNIGILFNNRDRTKWYPLSEYYFRDSKSKGYMSLENFRNMKSIITRDNKILIINPKNVNKINFLDEGQSQYQKFDSEGQFYDDWEFEMPYSMQGVSLSSLRLLKGENILEEYEENDIIGKFDDLSEYQWERMYFGQARIYFKDGSNEGHEIEGWAIKEFYLGKSDSDLLEIYLGGGDTGDNITKSFIHKNNIALIELPLLKLIDELQNNE